jgi:hypothetical protein
MVLPYLKGFLYILLFSVLVNGLVYFYWYFGFILRFIFISIRYLTIGIRSLSLAKKGDTFFTLFAYFF